MSKNKHERWQLDQMVSLPLEAKIVKSQLRIREWYDHWDSKVYVAFSGGKDSTVLLDLVRDMYPNVPAVFCDTGLEFPEIKEFVRTFDNVTVLRPTMSFKRVIDHYGYPVVSKEQSQFIDEYRNTGSEKLRDIRWNGNRWGRGKISEKWKFLVDAPFEISHKCCDVMKKNPSAKYERETGNKAFIGTMTEESQLRESEWIRHGCNAFDNKRPLSRPLSFWTEQDILQYLKIKNITYASVYGDIVTNDKDLLTTTGRDRTGCVWCMFGVHMEDAPNRFQQLSETHPHLYDYCIKPRDKNGLGLGEVLSFIGVDHSPKNEEM